MKSEAGTNEQIKSERLKGMRRTRTGWVSAKTREGVMTRALHEWESCHV